MYFTGPAFLSGVRACLPAASAGRGRGLPTVRGEPTPVVPSRLFGLDVELAPVGIDLDAGIVDRREGCS